jgi:hypothetical protein
MNYASFVAENSHPRDHKQAVATKENVVASLEGSNVLPTIDVQQKDVTLCVAISSSPGRQAGHPSSDIESEPQVVDSNDASDGLSMMAQEVHSDGTNVAVKGQRSSIFQTACKIQGKVCKLIIDGGSFTYAISSDLVHALSLSTWRLPTPRYMQWMNQSGTLKITHKARVKFSVGSYIDTMDCDVAPLTTCHLLLGRPWQFDLDATHGGHSNNYSLMHKGVNHVLKPMPESAIKAEVFATSKVKKKVAEIITPTPRMALLQEGENDVIIPDRVICDSIANVPPGATPNDSVMAIASPTIASENSITFPDIFLDSSWKPDVQQLCSNVIDVKQDGVKQDENMITSTTQCSTVVNCVEHLQKDATGFMSKPSTVLFEERENDEPMPPHQDIHADISDNILKLVGDEETHKNISKPRTALSKEGEDDEPIAPISNVVIRDSLEISGLKFGAVSFDEIYIKKAEEIFTIGGLSSKINFIGAHVVNKMEEKKRLKQYIFVGSIKIEIIGAG